MFFNDVFWFFSPVTRHFSYMLSDFFVTSQLTWSIEKNLWDSSYMDQLRKREMWKKGRKDWEKQVEFLGTKSQEKDTDCSLFL